MPVIGYLILLNGKVSDFLVLRLEFNAFAEHMSSLIWIYFGSFLVGLGSMLYTARCPAVFKKYADFPDYRNAERDLWRTPEFAGKKVEALRKEIQKNIEDMGNPAAMASRNHRAFTDIQALSADPNKVDEHLFSEWELIDRSRPFSRIFCAMFYVVGLGLLAVPSVRTFLKVLDFVAEAS